MLNLLNLSKRVSVSCHYPSGTFLHPLLNRQNYVKVRIIWFFFSIKIEAQFFQLSIPHFFSFTLSIAEYPRSGSNICHNLLPASSSSEEGSDVDTIAENQNTCPVKLVEGNQNNSAGLTISSAGTDKVFGKSKISLWIFQ